MTHPLANGAGGLVGGQDTLAGSGDGPGGPDQLLSVLVGHRVAQGGGEGGHDDWVCGYRRKGKDRGEEGTSTSGAIGPSIIVKLGRP